MSIQNVLDKLPNDPKDRKAIPLTEGVLDYFPLALAEVARVSKAGNDQHNPGQPLHWARDKSSDHANCIGRHLIQRGSLDSDGMRHSAKLAWRALALLQEELEKEAGFDPNTPKVKWTGFKPVDGVVHAAGCMCPICSGLTVKIGGCYACAGGFCPTHGKGITLTAGQSFSICPECNGVNGFHAKDCKA